MHARERFVPQRVGELTEALAEHYDQDERESFRVLSRITASLFHFEFYDREQELLSAWLATPTSESAGQVMSEELSGLLDAASYTQVSIAELDEALQTESLIPLRLDVDLADYDELLIYRRQARTESVEVKTRLGLKSTQKDITVDGRVVIYSRVQAKAWFDERDIDAADRNLIPGHVSLKQFQDVPRADIEMLLPSTQVKLRVIDSIKIGVPAFIGGLVVLTTKLASTLLLIAVLAGAWLGLREDTPEINQAELVVLLGGVVALGSFVMRQWTKLKNRKVDYLKTLSENLYFRTLSTGPGVLHTLLSSAEQQEVTEVLLGYHFIRANPSITIRELDVVVEKWLAEHSGVSVDFDVDDAVHKLRALGLLEGLRRLRVQPTQTSIQILDERWDKIFGGESDAGDLLPPAAGAAQPALIRFRKLVGRFAGGASERVQARDSARGD